MRQDSIGVLVALTLGLVKASPQNQLRLLELADLDAELVRLARRRQGLPEVAELAEMEARASELKDALVMAETELSDIAKAATMGLSSSPSNG